MKATLVSVVIPAYKQAEFLGEAIRSVLDQTYQHFEIVVISDASPDDTDAVVGSFDDARVNYIVHAVNQGLPATRNTGIRASKGDLVAFLDADDFFHPDKLRAHVEMLDARPDVGVTYNARFELNHSARSIRELWRPPTQVDLLDLVLGFPFAPSDMVSRRDWLFRVGLFDPSKGSAEDTDLPCRLALAGCTFADVGRALNYRRYHSGRGRKNLPGRLNDVRGALEAVFANPRCPARVLAIRDTALKHHVMVVASLALLQEETALAHDFLRDLVRIDPSVVEGRPCELVAFLMMESVADHRLDHELLLRRMFAQLPPDLAAVTTQLGWAVARGHLWKGLRAALWDRVEDGQVDIAKAAELGAELGHEFDQFLTSHLLNHAEEFGAQAASAALERLASCLRLVGGRSAAGRLKGCYQVTRAFEEYRGGDPARVPGLVARALANDPAYMTNRGVLAMLLRSIARIQPNRQPPPSAGSVPAG